MLEKLNSIIYNESTNTVVKCVTSRLESIAEKASLEVLAQSVSPDKECPLLVPKLYNEESTDYAVCMEYVPGIRVYDLTALLNQIIRVNPDRSVVAKAYSLKNGLIEYVIQCVRRFQSTDVQGALRAAAGTAIAPYDFKGKLIEALDYLCARFDVATSNQLYDEAAYIADFLAARVEVAFRDATLKNFIVKLPNVDGAAHDYCDIAETVGDYLRPTNWQWTDTGLVPKLLDDLGKTGPLERSIYNIDFESTYALTTKQDDFLHIFTLEVVGISYDVAQQFFARHLAVSEEELNVAILFRCLRDGTRRLFYKCERPAIFATRYYHETVDHNLLVALDALERLRQNSNSAEFLGQLYQLLCKCRKGYAPWPWQMSVLPLEFIG